MWLLWIIGIALIIYGVYCNLLIFVIGFGAGGPGLHAYHTRRMKIFYSWLPLSLFVVFVTKLYILLIIPSAIYVFFQKKYQTDLINWGYGLADKVVKRASI